MVCPQHPMSLLPSVSQCHRPPCPPAESVETAQVYDRIGVDASTSVTEQYYMPRLWQHDPSKPQLASHTAELLRSLATASLPTARDTADHTVRGQESRQSLEYVCLTYDH